MAILAGLRAYARTVGIALGSLIAVIPFPQHVVQKIDVFDQQTHNLRIVIWESNLTVDTFLCATCQHDPINQSHACFVNSYLPLVLVHGSGKEAGSGTEDSFVHGRSTSITADKYEVRIVSLIIQVLQRSDQLDRRSITHPCRPRWTRSVAKHEVDF